MERFCGGAFGGGGWLVLVGLFLLVLSEGVWWGAMRVFGGLGWACCMWCVVGGSACLRWCCGRGGVVRVFGSFGDRSFFGIVCVFLFPRRAIVSGCLSIMFFVADVVGPLLYAGCVVVVGAFC